MTDKLTPGMRGLLSTVSSLTAALQERIAEVMDSDEAARREGAETKRCDRLDPPACLHPDACKTVCTFDKPASAHYAPPAAEDLAATPPESPAKYTYGFGVLKADGTFKGVIDRDGYEGTSVVGLGETRVRVAIVPEKDAAEIEALRAQVRELELSLQSALNGRFSRRTKLGGLVVVFRKDMDTLKARVKALEGALEKIANFAQGEGHAGNLIADIAREALAAGGGNGQQ